MRRIIFVAIVLGGATLALTAAQAQQMRREGVSPGRAMPSAQAGMRNGNAREKAQERATAQQMDRQQIMANADKRQAQFDAAMAKAQEQVQAIKDKAAAENRELTPGETARIAGIEKRLADAKESRDKEIAARLAAVEERKETAQERNRRISTIDRDRRANAGLGSASPVGGMNGVGGTARTTRP